jgi:hypothetical protein
MIITIREEFPMKLGAENQIRNQEKQTGKKIK